MMLEAGEAAGLGLLVQQWAVSKRNAVFLQDLTGAMVTYALFDQLAGRSAAALYRLGVRKGDRVLTLCENQIAYFAAVFGAWRIGAVVFSLAHEQRGQILAQMLHNADPALLLVDDSGRGALASLTEPVSQDILQADIDAFTLASDSMLVQPPEVDAVSPALILYSSGTTGVSKGCVLSHGFLVISGRDFCRASDVTESDAVYSAGPFSHLNSWWAFAGAIVSGIRFTFDLRFSASRFWERAEAADATLFDYVGVMIAILLRRDEMPGPRSRLRAGLGGAARPDEMRAFQERFAIPLLECYGLTECCLPIYQRESELVPGTIGLLADSVDAKLVDESGATVASGDRGELWLRARDPRVMFSGYWRRDDLTAAAFNGSWFRTGDICTWDDKGYFRYVDRKRHFIRRRGENISTFEVEGVIFDHPAVANCAVIGVPAEIGDEDILVAVQPKEGVTIDPAEFLKWCRGHLASFMVPRYVRVLKLPLTPSERVEKQKLRDEGLVPDTFDDLSVSPAAVSPNEESAALVRALGMRYVGAPELIAIADPGPPKADEVRVGMELVALSIAEVRAARGDRFRHFGQKLDPRSPFVFGFAGVGRVVASGSQALDVGARVVLSGLASCGSCTFCRRRLENHCLNLKFSGIDVDSRGFACEFVTLPARRVFPVPDSLALEKCCVVSEVATAIHLLQRGRLVAGETVGVVGAGRHGRQIVRVAKRLGARVVAVDPDANARELALLAGADGGLAPDAIEGHSFPLVVYANSVESSVHTCLDIAEFGARIVLLGTPAGLDVKIEEFMRRVVHSECELIGTDSKNPEEFTLAIEMMATGDEDWDIRRPRRLGLADAGPALIDAARNWPIADDLFVELTAATTAG